MCPVPNQKVMFLEGKSKAFCFSTEVGIGVLTGFLASEGVQGGQESVGEVKGACWETVSVEGGGT